MNNNIIDVINNDLCTGCGACLYKNNVSGLKMYWNNEGFLVPNFKVEQYKNIDEHVNVCPFNPSPEKEVLTEDEISKIFLNETPNFHSKVGKYYNTYVGYSEQNRLTSSSGGLATYFLLQLFEKRIIDAVITVGDGDDNFFMYKLIKTKEELLETSKTKYYPVSLATSLKELENFEGNVAIVGVGCFIKAVRLLQHYNPELKNKIVFTIGIICGGIKSKFFAEYLASKAGVNENQFIKPQFRIKDFESNAGDYSFGCTDLNGNEKQIKMKSVGEMWGTGLFKCNACDFCDDVTSELADISLGDAWIPPYSNDGKGTNVIVTRSILSENILKEGINNKNLNVKELPFDTFLSSQQGSYNHRHKGLPYRIKFLKQKGNKIPPKRIHNEKITIDFKIVQILRMGLRRKSLVIWIEKPNSHFFDYAIKKYLKKLRIVTMFYHYKQTIVSRLWSIIK